MQFWCVVKQTPLSIFGDGVLSLRHQVFFRQYY